MAGLHQGWHVVCDFSRAAPWQQDDDWFGSIQFERGRKLVTRSFRLNIAHQGMPDKIRRHAACAIPILFEWENAQPAHESPAYQVRAPRTPGPELRANKINILDALPLQCSREAQVETGEIREDRKARLPLLGFPEQTFPYTVERGKFFGNFDDSDQRNFRAIRDQFDSCFTHAWAAHAEEMRICPRLQRCRQTRCIHVAGSFTRGDQNLCGWHRLTSGRLAIA